MASGLYLEKRVWWNFLEADLKGLLKEAEYLLNAAATWDKQFHDYAFIVFPAAKAYEGFLKTAFLKKGFISQDDYLGKRFRIGKALNPSLDRRYREKEGVYDKITKYCGGDEKLANLLWETWKECRNTTFHWFPKERNAINYKEAKQRLLLILKSMDEFHKQCKI